MTTIKFFSLDSLQLSVLICVKRFCRCFAVELANCQLLLPPWATGSLQCDPDGSADCPRADTRYRIAQHFPATEQAICIVHCHPGHRVVQAFVITVAEGGSAIKA